MDKSVSLAKKNRIFIDKEAKRKGKLIVIEGNDGSGKSTTIKYLSKYLKSIGVKNIIVKFNMSYITLKSIKKGKKSYFGPYTNTLIHSTSIVDQFERYALRKLQKGYVVICDRYIYSIIARGIVRGVKEETINDLLNWVIEPDLSFYLDIDPVQALDRIGSDNITFWEAGKDIIYGKEIDECFLEFQSKVRNEFLKHLNEWKLNIIDANLPFQIRVKKIYEKMKDKNIQ